VTTSRPRLASASPFIPTRRRWRTTARPTLDVDSSADFSCPIHPCAAQTRLTLLIAWYNEPTAVELMNAGGSSRGSGPSLAAQCRVPRATRAQTWPADLEMTDEEVALDSALDGFSLRESTDDAPQQAREKDGAASGTPISFRARELAVRRARPVWVAVPGEDQDVRPSCGPSMCKSSARLSGKTHAACALVRDVASAEDGGSSGDDGGTGSSGVVVVGGDDAEDIVAAAGGGKVVGVPRQFSRELAALESEAGLTTPRSIAGRNGIYLTPGKVPTSLDPPPSLQQHFFLISADEVGARLRDEHGLNGTWAWAHAAAANALIEEAAPQEAALPSAKRPRETRTPVGDLV